MSQATELSVTAGLPGAVHTYTSKAPAPPVIPPTGVMASSVRSARMQPFSMGMGGRRGVGFASLLLMVGLGEMFRRIGEKLWELL